MDITTSSHASTEPHTTTEPRLPLWARAILAILALQVAAWSAVPYWAVLQALGVEASGPGAASIGLQVLLLAGQALITLSLYLGLSALLVRRVDRRPVRALGLAVTPRAIGGLGLGMGISLVVALAAYGLVTALGIGREMPLPVDEDMPTWLLIAYVLILAFVLQGIGEEALFRGYLLQSGSRRPHRAVLVSAIAFTLPHLLSQGGQQGLLEHLVYLVIPFGFSLSAAYLAIAMRSVWAAVGIHAGFHVATAVCLALGMLIEGPALWAVLGTLHAIAGVVIARFIPRERWAKVAAAGPYGR